MKRAAFALSLTFALVAPLQAQDTLPPDQEITIDLAAGMVRYFRVVRPFNEINIGDAGVADVASIQSDRILITAKRPGQTDVMISDAGNTVLARIHVKVVPPQQYGRRTVTVRRFGQGSTIMSHTAYCERTLGMTADEPGPCYFEKTEPNLVGAPVISTGPVITTGNVANVPAQ
jgi:hypothetical protein